MGRGDSVREGLLMPKLSDGEWLSLIAAIKGSFPRGIDAEQANRQLRIIADWVHHVRVSSALVRLIMDGELNVFIDEMGEANFRLTPRRGP